MHRSQRFNADLKVGITKYETHQITNGVHLDIYISLTGDQELVN